LGPNVTGEVLCEIRSKTGLPPCISLPRLSDPPEFVR